MHTLASRERGASSREPNSKVGHHGPRNSLNKREGGGEKARDGRNTQDNRETGEKAIRRREDPAGAATGTSHQISGSSKFFELTGPDYCWGPFHCAGR